MKLRRKLLVRLFLGFFDVPICQTSDSCRDVGRWGLPVFEYASEKQMLIGDLARRGIHTARLGGGFLDIRVADRQSKTTIVSFHPALKTRLGIKLPVFVGQTIAGMKANLIMVSDPGLYYSDSLPLAWFAGAADLPVQSILPAVLTRAAACLGTERLIFTGISGGGFASLFYSSLFPDSLAITINPQTNIRLFSRAAADAYVSACFGPGADVDQVLDAYITSDLVRLYSGGFQNYVLYLQNENDHHLRLHAMPFFDGLRQEDGSRATLIIGSDWGDGHVGPPAPYISAVLADAVAADDLPSFIGRLRSSSPSMV